MMLLDRAAYSLRKVQDLVNRLLHESLGGDLVDTSSPDWEEHELKRDKVGKGLKSKLATGALSQADYDAISSALQLPEQTPKLEITRMYRNRLTHHIRPSVDDPRFYSFIEPRAGQPIFDQRGNIRGTRHKIFPAPPVEYQFRELHTAFHEYLDAIVAMLEKLSQIPLLRS
jgi:hypothetical protein